MVNAGVSKLGVRGSDEAKALRVASSMLHAL